MYKEIIALMWVLVATIAILGLAYWTTRRMAGLALFGGIDRRTAGENVKVISRVPIGKNEALVIVQVAARQFLLGVTANSITVLAEFSEEETALMQAREEDPSREGQPNFAQVVREFLQQKQKR